MTSRAAHAISWELLSPSSASSMPEARPSTSATVSSSQHSRSFANASSSGSSSEIPAAALIISASGQYGDALAVRETASGENAGALETVHELPGEAALPDSRLAEDGEEMRTPVANGARERVLEELELGLPADERRARALRPRGTVDRIDETPGPQRGSHPLQLERAGILDDRGSLLRAGMRSARSESRPASRPAGVAPPGSRPRRWRRWTRSPRRRARRPRCRSSLRARALRRPGASRARRGRRARRRPRGPAGRRTPPAPRLRRTSRRSRHAASTQCETFSKNLFTRRRTTSGSEPVTRPVEFTRSMNKHRGELSLHDVSVETNAGVAVIPRRSASAH